MAPAVNVLVQPMAAGQGEESYTRNSLVQQSIYKIVEPALMGALTHRADFFVAQECIRIADFGCSTGKNAILQMTAVVAHLHDLRGRPAGKHSSSAQAPPASSEGESQAALQDVMAFFSDLPSNDFNTLFQLLPPRVQGCRKTLEAGSDGMPLSRSFHAGAVPGSFFDQLFPRNFLHVATTNSAIHFLSSVPKAMCFPEGGGQPALVNRGHYGVVYDEPGPVLDAFQEQAHADLCAFLRARAQELVPGGLLWINTIARQPRPHEGLLREIMDKAWQSMIDDGILTQESLDMFNFPGYFRTEEEIAAAVSDVDGLFSIHSLELMEGPMMAVRHQPPLILNPSE